jgi:putative transposase
LVGINRGVKTMAVLSDGTVYENPRISDRFAKKLRRLNKELARREFRGRNWEKTKRKLQRLHYRITCCRNDAIHKFTTEVSRKYHTVCLEKLNTAGMLRNHRLARAIQDVSFYEIERQFGYKAAEVRYVDQWFPSSRTCSGCGHLCPADASTCRTCRCLSGRTSARNAGWLWIET